MRNLCIHIFLAILVGISFCGAAQQTGFTATIGVNTYTVKKGDVLRVCKGGTIVYTNKATNYNTLEWRYNNGATFSNFNNVFSVTYNTTGNNFYTVQLLNEGTPSADSLKVTIVVADKESTLQAKFDYTPSSLECGSTVFTFDAANSTGTGLSYNWNFGDGSTATGKKVTHSFNTSIGSGGNQNFNVILTVTNIDGCSDVQSQPVTVKSIPDTKLINDAANADLTSFGNLTTFCKSETLPNFDFIFINAASTASNVKDIFDWGDGTPNTTLNNWASNATITHNYTPGNHVLTRTATGSNGCTRTEQFNVFLGKNSGSKFGTVDNVTDYCVGEPKFFTITPGADNPPGTQYILRVNDCSVDSIYYDLQAGVEYTVPHYFMTPQCESNCGFVPFYTARLLTVNPCKTTELTYPNLNVWGKPKARIISDTVACINSTLSFDNASNFGTVYENGNCINTGIQVWTVSPSTGISFNSAQAGNLNGDASDWKKWTAGSGTLNITFNTPGIYYITLHISNKKCGIDTITQKVCIQNKPKAIFNFTDLDADACLSDTITFKNNSVNEACINNKYSWAITNSDPNGCSNGDAPVYITGNSTALSPEVWFRQPGNYRITLNASAIASCFDTTSKILIIKGKPKIVLSTINDICTGNTITPTATAQDCYSGETLSYKWDFPNGSPTASTQLNPGNIAYAATGIQTVSFSAANSCGTSISSQTFSVIDKPIANAGNDVLLCEGDGKTIGTNTGNYTYSWSPATGLSNPNIATPLVTLTYKNSSADTVIYTVKVSAGTNCESTDKVRAIVQQKPNVLVSANNINICKGGADSVMVSGADAYTWSPSSGISTTTGSKVIFNPTTTTVYTVTGILANGCSDSKQVIVNVNAAAAADAGPTDTVCNGATISIGVNTGNFNYSWQPPTYLSSSLSAVTAFTPTGYTKDTTVKYILTADAGAGCLATDSVFIRIKKSPSIIVSPNNPQVCEGDTIAVTAKGADTYNWQPAIYLDTNTGPVVNINPAVTTDYTVTGTLANGCSNTDLFTVKVKPDAIARFTADYFEGCAGFNLKDIIQTESHPAENINYIWHLKDKTGNSLQTFNTATPPDYILQNPGDSVAVFLVATSKTGCKDDTTQTYIFKAGNGVVAAFLKNNGNGCEPISEQFMNTSSLLNNSVNFLWDLGNGTTSTDIQPPVQQYTTLGYYRDTTYYISLKASNACSNSEYRDSLKVKAAPLARFGTDSTFGCSPLILTFRNTSLGNPTNFLWEFEDSTFNTTGYKPFTDTIFSSSLDTITVKLTATNACSSSTDSINLVIAPNIITPNINVFGNNNYICAPDTVTFNNSTIGALSASWDFGDGSSLFLPGNQVYVKHIYNLPGTYYVKTVFENGCSKATDVDSIIVLEKPEAAFELLPVRNEVVCLNDTVRIRITAQTGDFNKLFWGDTSLYVSPPDTAHLYLSSGTYTITLLAERISNVGVVCSATATKIIKLGARATYSRPSATIIDCFNYESQLQVSGGVKYVWLPDENLYPSNKINNPKSRVDSTTRYYVDVYSESGCVVTDSVSVVVDYSNNQHALDMPSAFTPNGDGLNDCFGPHGRGNLRYMEFAVYDRRGFLLFQSTDPSACWDGYYGGKLQPRGTYVYYLKAQSPCETGTNKGVVQKGTIVLIR